MHVTQETRALCLVFHHLLKTTNEILSRLHTEQGCRLKINTECVPITYIKIKNIFCVCLTNLR